MTLGVCLGRCNMVVVNALLNLCLCVYVKLPVLKICRHVLSALVM
jgi:hypothetical protein